MSEPLKAVVDISVIPNGWSLDKWMKVAEGTGFLVVDTYQSGVEDLGVKVVDEDNFELITIEEYEKRKQ